MGFVARSESALFLSCRYLWTDAFGVCNYITLAAETGQEAYLDQVRSLPAALPPRGPSPLKWRAPACLVISRDCADRDRDPAAGGRADRLGAQLAGPRARRRPPPG